MAYIGPPPGTVFSFAGSSAPTGYLLCDGSSVLRATYADLFAAIGVTYGSVDGTHFTLPDAQGRAVYGVGTHTDVNALAKSDGIAVGTRRPKHSHTNTLAFTGGSFSGTLPNHVHSVTDPGHTHTVPLVLGSGSNGAGTNAIGGSQASGTNTTGISVGNPTSNPAISGSITGGSTSGTVGIAGMTDTPSYLVLNYIIKT